MFPHDGRVVGILVGDRLVVRLIVIELRLIDDEVIGALHLIGRIECDSEGAARLIVDKRILVAIRELGRAPVDLQCRGIERLTRRIGIGDFHRRHDLLERLNLDDPGDRLGGVIDRGTRIHGTVRRIERARVLGALLHKRVRLLRRHAVGADGPGICKVRRLVDICNDRLIDDPVCLGRIGKDDLELIHQKGVEAVAARDLRRRKRTVVRDGELVHLERGRIHLNAASKRIGQRVGETLLIGIDIDLPGDVIRVVGIRDAVRLLADRHAARRLHGCGVRAKRGRAVIQGRVVCEGCPRLVGDRRLIRNHERVIDGTRRGKDRGTGGGEIAYEVSRHVRPFGEVAVSVHDQLFDRKRRRHAHAGGQCVYQFRGVQRPLTHIGVHRPEDGLGVEGRVRGAGLVDVAEARRIDGGGCGCAARRNLVGQRRLRQIHNARRINDAVRGMDVAERQRESGRRHDQIGCIICNLTAQDAAARGSHGQVIELETSRVVALAVAKRIHDIDARQALELAVDIHRPGDRTGVILLVGGARFGHGLRHALGREHHRDGARLDAVDREDDRIGVLIADGGCVEPRFCPRLAADVGVINRVLVERHRQNAGR